MIGNGLHGLEHLLLNEFADDETSSQGKAENIMASLERSMHPELMKVHLFMGACLQLTGLHIKVLMLDSI